MDPGTPTNLDWVYERTTIARWLYDTPDPHHLVHVKLGVMPDGVRWWVSHTGSPAEGPSLVFADEATARSGVDRVAAALALARGPGRWIQVTPYS